MASVESPPVANEANSRSFARAFADLKTGLDQRELWAHLGWQDIKQRYRRSFL
ncbi:MAG: ABC transporter permease, partial [Mycobacteriaceae bacterium]